MWLLDLLRQCNLHQILCLNHVLVCKKVFDNPRFIRMALFVMVCSHLLENPIHFLKLFIMKIGAQQCKMNILLL